MSLTVRCPVIPFHASLRFRVLVIVLDVLPHHSNTDQQTFYGWLLTADVFSPTAAAAAMATVCLGITIGVSIQTVQPRRSGSPPNAGLLWGFDDVCTSHPVAS